MIHGGQVEENKLDSEDLKVINMQILNIFSKCKNMQKYSFKYLQNQIDYYCKKRELKFIFGLVWLQKCTFLSLM